MFWDDRCGKRRRTQGGGATRKRGGGGEAAAAARRTHDMLDYGPRPRTGQRHAAWCAQGRIRSARPASGIRGSTTLVTAFDKASRLYDVAPVESANPVRVLEAIMVGRCRHPGLPR